MALPYLYAYPLSRHYDPVYFLPFSRRGFPARSLESFKAIRSRSLTTGQSVAALPTLPLRFPAVLSSPCLRSLNSTLPQKRTPVSEFAAPPELNVTLVQFSTLSALFVSVCQCQQNCFHYLVLGSIPL